MITESVKSTPSKSKRPLKKITEKEFDKYWYYHRSVQSPEIDVKFFRKLYKEIRGTRAEILREDFCGTFSISCEWAKLDPSHLAIGVDLDDEPISYGKTHYLPKLKPVDQARVRILNDNVLSPKLPKADIIAALNFSYYIFKQRELMKEYFANCFKTLKPNGIFILDAFGGTACQEPNVEETEHDGFSYFWDQDSFNPITNEALFYIHFKLKGKKKFKKVFTYDWRMWSLPELRDILNEVGFKSTHVYWEGTTKDGEGDGIFKKTNVGEDCESWVAYLVAEK